MSEIERICKEKEQQLLAVYFGNLVQDAAHRRPETIGIYTQDLPQKIEAAYRQFLQELWQEAAPESLRGKPLPLDEEKLREVLTADDCEAVHHAYQDATRQTLWERITKSNHRDVTFYKGLLQEYTRELLRCMRLDFLEEITGNYIENKAF